MKLKRFFRDFAVLLGFCGAFYFLTVAMSRLDKTPVDDSDFSAVRKRADVSMRERDWESASDDYLSLAEKDPYNGHAWYRCASSFNAQRNLIFSELQAAQADALDTLESSDADSESEDKSALLIEAEKLLDSLQAELDGLSVQAKDAFKKAKEFARYRADSLLNLAAIESYEGHNSESLGYLVEFVDNGYYTARGLSNYRVFGNGGAKYASPGLDLDNSQVRLHREPKFWEVVRKEAFNH